MVNVPQCGNWGLGSDTTIQRWKAETWGHTHPLPSGLWPSPSCSLPGMATSNSNSWAMYGFTRRMEGIPYSISFWEEAQGHHSQSWTWAGTCGLHISLELLEKELARCPPAQKKTSSGNTGQEKLICKHYIFGGCVLQIHQVKVIQTSLSLVQPFLSLREALCLSFINKAICWTVLLNKTSTAFCSTNRLLRGNNNNSCHWLSVYKERKCSIYIASLKPVGSLQIYRRKKWVWAR